MTPEAPAVTLAEALAQAAAAGVDRVDAQALMTHLLQRDRAWLIAHDSEILTADTLVRWQDWCQRRAAGEPVAYLIGQREFHGLPLQVNPAVLIPRPDTETLVDWALQVLAAHPDRQNRPLRVLDLGTGSGAVALAIARRHPGAQVTATDRSAPALATARANGERLGLPVQWLLGDWWQALDAAPASGTAPRPPFDLVLSNPPYIAAGDPHLQALRHEPLSALVAGHDGLDDLKALIADAPRHLADGGWLLLEHGHDQATAVAGLLRAVGLHGVTTVHDLGGVPRCTGGRR